MLGAGSDGWMGRVEIESRVRALLGSPPPSLSPDPPALLGTRLAVFFLLPSLSPDPPGITRFEIQKNVTCPPL